MPNQPKTPHRSIRVSEEEWEAWKAAAEEDGMTLADFIRATMNNRIKRRVIRRSKG